MATIFEIIESAALTPVQRFVFFYKMRSIHDSAGGANMYLSPDKVNRLEELRGRVALRKKIAEMQVNGMIYLICQQMDCDCASWTSRHAIKADLEEYLGWIDCMYEDAEGPLNWRIVTKDEYDNFKRESRDHALEAFENGHAHIIHI